MSEVADCLDKDGGEETSGSLDKAIDWELSEQEPCEGAGRRGTRGPPETSANVESLISEKLPKSGKPEKPSLRVFSEAADAAACRLWSAVRK